MFHFFTLSFVLFFNIAQLPIIIVEGGLRYGSKYECDFVIEGPL